MKVLWLTNKVLPAVATAAGISNRVVNEGWISGIFESLSDREDIDLNILCGWKGDFRFGKNTFFNWYLYPENEIDEYTYSSIQENLFFEVLNKVNPDIIHIWGSEYPHSLAMLNAAKRHGIERRVVVWIQGLISACSLPYYYYAGVPEKVINKQTLYDLILKTGIKSQQKKFSKRGKYEIELLENISHCIGRTMWDKRYVMSINPHINYHSCNETLRECFYDGIWKFEKCNKYTIFFSQASYPLKGFHILLKAMPIILKHYPETKIRVSGYDIMGLNSLVGFLKLKGYGRYLRDLVLQYDLGSKIVFTGRLSAEDMKLEYLNSNVFVSSSSLENSSNSIGEAMLLGTPTVISQVGGTESIIDYHLETDSFKNLNSEQLAKAVINVFSDVETAQKKASLARLHAMKTHDKVENLNTLVYIYNLIVK